MTSRLEQAEKQASKATLPPTLTPLQATAYAEVLKFRADTARHLLAAELRAARPDPRALLVLDCADFAEVILKQDIRHYPAAVDAMGDRIDQLEAAAKRQPGPWPTYAAAEIRLHRAIARICFEDEIQGAWDLRTAMQELEAAAKKYPDFLPIRKSLGLGQFLIGVIPDTYQWFLRLLGLRGSVPAGLANLNRAADEANPFQTEAKIYRALIRESYYHQPDEARTLAADLFRRQPDNLLFAYLNLAILKRQKQPDAALRAFRARPTGRGYIPLFYLHHMAADLLLYRGEYAASMRENEFFLRRYPGPHYRKDACYKLYLAAWIQHDQPTAARWLAQIPAQGKALIEEDRVAKAYYEDRPPLSEPLLRARLAADGGYWKLAQRHLNGFPLATGTPRALKAEWCYRQAKVYQGQNRLDSTRFFYQRTIQVAGDEPRYFAPNAALQLGFLYRAAGDAKTARTWFEKAMTYEKHEYKRSIDSQAKAALAN